MCVCVCVCKEIVSWLEGVLMGTFNKIICCDFSSLGLFSLRYWIWAVGVCLK